MKTWIKRGLLGLGAAALLVGGLAACGHRGHHPGWGQMGAAEQTEWRERMVSRAADKLDLDSGQKAKLNALAEAMAAQRLALVPSGTHPRDEFSALLAGTRLDRVKAQGLVDSKIAAVQAQSPQVVAAAGDFYDSLKPDQQQKLRDFLSRGRGRHR